MTTTLIILPTDLLALIISYIRAPSDLRNVSLTCKALYAVAVVPIYQSMTLRLFQVDNRKLLQALVPENAALGHVRHLVIDPFTHCLTENTENVLMTLQLLANFLPRDSLVSFTLDWPILREASTHLILQASSILETLYRRQRRLRTMRVDPCADQAQIRRYGNLSNVTTFQFEVSSKTTAETCGSALELTPSLRNLEIRAHLEKCDTAPQRDQMSARLVENVFGNFLKHDRQIVLRALQLRGFDLSSASAKLAKAIDLCRIQSLGLHHCSNMVDFLDQMKPADELRHPTLRTLVLVARSDTGRSASVTTVNCLLESFTGLENLVVAALWQGALMPGFKALGNHAATLRLLYIDCGPLPWDASDANIVTASNLHLLLGRCIQLEQIALEMPELVLAYIDTEIDKSSKKIAVALAAAPRLRTFRPHNQLEDRWFEARFGLDGWLDKNKVTYAGIEALLQHWATSFMSLSPGLTAMGLGFSRHRTDLLGIEVDRHYYVRGHQLDPYGGKSIVAMRMELDRVREIEPVSEILEINPYGPGLFRLGYQP
ncbi:hypothetical protein D0862_08747 [Hortaea werneckii]|uniref:F-box domain-containing protein n=1 Tax=Hortaea werneckii TaxID=91943 RepID=A0A3M7G3V4_HORWE|nr:hypothetical protein D0862_08747 [Hortaea werneckii]